MEPRPRQSSLSQVSAGHAARPAPRAQTPYALPGLSSGAQVDLYCHCACLGCRSPTFQMSLGDAWGPVVLGLGRGCCWLLRPGTSSCSGLCSPASGLLAALHLAVEVAPGPEQVQDLPGWPASVLTPILPGPEDVGQVS